MCLYNIQRENLVFKNSLCTCTCSIRSQGSSNSVWNMYTARKYTKSTHILHNSLLFKGRIPFLHIFIFFQPFPYVAFCTQKHFKPFKYVYRTCLNLNKILWYDKYKVYFLLNQLAALHSPKNGLIWEMLYLTGCSVHDKK